MSRSDSRPGPSLGLFIPPRRWSRCAAPPRRASQVPQPIFLRAPSPITPRSPAVACAHCFAASIRFHPHRKTDHFPFALTRPKRVHLRYGSRIRRSRLRPAGLLPLTLDWLPVERAITGQAPFSLQDQPDLSWHTNVCATRKASPQFAGNIQWVAIQRNCRDSSAPKERGPQNDTGRLFRGGIELPPGSSTVRMRKRCPKHDRSPSCFEKALFHGFWVPLKAA